MTDEPYAAPESRQGWRHLLQPYVVLPLVNTAAVLAYGAGDVLPVSARGAASLAASTLASMGLYYLLIAAAPRRIGTAIFVALLFAAALTAMHTVALGYWCYFRNLVPVSVMDYARQMPAHSLELAWERLAPVYIAAVIAGAALLAAYVAYGVLRPRPPMGRLALTLAALPWVPLALAGQRPFLTLDHYFVATAMASYRGAGATARRFVPDRLSLPPLSVQDPPNIVFFQLESVACDACTVYAPDLATTPFLSRFVREHQDEAFVVARQFSNSSASDVAIPMMFNGAAPDDPLFVHRTAPMLWDYAKAAGYNTSFYMAAAFAWSELGVRFQQRPGHTNLDHAVHAGNAGKPVVHDLSLADSDVMAASLDYLRQRSWAGPFLVCVNLKMPHLLGQGAHMSGLRHLNQTFGAGHPLIGYYNAVYEDDRLIGEFIQAMPPAVRKNTVILAVSDHGEDIYGRGARLESYRVEIALVPCILYVPRAVQQRLPAGAVEALRANARDMACANVDLLPTLLDLMGVADQPAVRQMLGTLRGQSLVRPMVPHDVIVMLNTNDLRSWEREGFALTFDNGAVRYLYDQGREELYDLATDPREDRDLFADPRWAPALQRARKAASDDPYLSRIVRKYAGRQG